MRTFTNEYLRAMLPLGVRSSTAEIDFLPFLDLDQSVRDDLANLRDFPLLARGTEIDGYVYDVQSGRIRRIL